jgi:5'-nucleotidase
VGAGWHGGILQHLCAGITAIEVTLAGELRADRGDARAAQRDEPRKVLLQRPAVRVDAEAHDVYFLATPASRDFHPRHEPHAEWQRGLACFGNPCRGVVIRQRQHAHAPGCCPLDQLPRREYAIRVMAVGVQIDEVVHAAGIIRSMTDTVRIPDHIDTLVLDLDGTLLDLGFDTHFWLEIVPACYGRAHGLSPQQALEQEILPRMRSAEGTLNWYCLDYWSRMLELDLSAIKMANTERICWLPGAQDFLRRQRAAGRRLVLATNSHPETLRIKDAKAGIRPFFDEFYSSHDFRAPKEFAEFWLRLRNTVGYDPQRTAFVDDNPRVLAAARNAGIGLPIAVTDPDSTRPARLPPPGYLHVSGVALIA